MVPSDQNSGHSAEGRCELCGRLLAEDRLTRHHLLPRSRARKMKRRSKGRRELKRRDPGRTVALCAPVTETYTSLSTTQTLHEAMIPWRRLETIPECGGSRSG
jgi:hypothetical protein